MHNHSLIHESEPDFFFFTCCFNRKGLFNVKDSNSCLSIPFLTHGFYSYGCLQSKMVATTLLHLHPSQRTETKRDRQKHLPSNPSLHLSSLLQSLLYHMYLFSLTRTQLYDHTWMQGSLGNSVFLLGTCPGLFFLRNNQRLLMIHVRSCD